MNRSEQKKVLEAFSRALNQETHNLVGRPDLLWQQLYNRLQWVDDLEGQVAKVIAPEFKKRSKPGAQPWLHLLSPLRESQALVRTIRGHIHNYNSHAGNVHDFAFSPDGKLVVSTSNEGSLKLWEVATGANLVTLKGHTDLVNSCAFSPDGKLIVSSSGEILKLWEVATGKERATLKGHTFYAFSPDSKLIVSASEDGTLKLWEVANAKEIVTLEGHTEGVNSCAFSPDGDLIVSAGEDNTLKLWEVATGDERVTLEGHTGPVRLCAFSPDGRYILSASDDATLRLWDAATGEGRARLIGHFHYEIPHVGTEETIIKDSYGSISSCAFSPDGKLVVSASMDKTLKLWEVATGKEIVTLEGHSGWVNSCAFSPDGELIVSSVLYLK